MIKAKLNSSSGTESKDVSGKNEDDKETSIGYTTSEKMTTYPEQTSQNQMGEDALITQEKIIGIPMQEAITQVANLYEILSKESTRKLEATKPILSPGANLTGFLEEV